MLSKMLEVAAQMNNQNSANPNEFQAKLFILAGLVAQLTSFESYYTKSLNLIGTEKIKALCTLFSRFPQAPNQAESVSLYKQNFGKWMSAIMLENGRKRFTLFFIHMLHVIFLKISFISILSLLLL